MHAHRDQSILDTIPGMLWEAVEIEHLVGVEGLPDKIYIVHEVGPIKKMIQIIKWLRKRDAEAGTSLTDYSTYMLRPIGSGRLDLDFSGRNSPER